MEKLTEEEQRKFYLKKASKVNLVDWLMEANRKLESATKFKLKLIGATREPHRCPVCQGNGLVPNGFYRQTSRAWSTSDATPEQCKSCAGSGLVWSISSNQANE